MSWELEAVVTSYLGDRTLGKHKFLSSGGRDLAWRDVVCVPGPVPTVLPPALLFAFADRVPPIPHSGEVSPVLPVQRHCGDCLQSPWVPRQALVSFHGTVFSYQLVKIRNG